MQVSSTILLSAKRIGKSFSGHRVLHDVQFELKAGEVHILAGENGAGKSTLIKILAGIHPDFDGSLELNSDSVSVIHQELSLIDSMSVEDNMFLGREMSRKAQRRRAKELCALLALDIDLALPVESFPMSVKNRIEIAKALVKESRIIIMDEPTSALTQPECEKFFGLIKELRARGCGIIYISHKMEEIYRLGDRITVLRDGRWIGTSKAAELHPGELVRWMIGRELTQQYPARTVKPRETALKVESFSIPGRVHDVSFSVRKGEVLGIAGLQGSGNSDLLEGLFGTHGAQTSGRLQLDGNRFFVRSPQRSIQQGLALVTNDRKTTGLVLNRAIRENISLASLRKLSPLGWIDEGAEKQLVRGWMKNLNVRAASAEQESGSLSGGNQQKVVLAKWLETNPKVLLLDEPTRGVDVGAKKEIYDLINALTEKGIAVVFISTEMPELLGLADRIAVMHRGRVTAEFSRTVATQEKILRAAMGESAA